MPAQIEIRDANWDHDREALRKLRHEVFVIGQNVPEDLEWDGEDVDCVHALALMNGNVVGTGRMTLTGKIGRMAVLESARGRGVGAGILQHLMGMAESMGITQVRLNAQTHALEFYARFGFEAEGDEFDEAGIPHLHMVCELSASHQSTTH